MTAPVPSKVEPEPDASNRLEIDNDFAQRTARKSVLETYRPRRAFRTCAGPRFVTIVVSHRMKQAGGSCQGRPLAN
jgi:hypothetical protein